MNQVIAATAIAAIVVTSPASSQTLPLLPDAIHSIGLRPTHTALGHQHARLVEQLLR